MRGLAGYAPAACRVGPPWPSSVGILPGVTRQLAISGSLMQMHRPDRSHDPLASHGRITLCRSDIHGRLHGHPSPGRGSKRIPGGYPFRARVVTLPDPYGRATARGPGPH
jgi:hypothetical protein